MAIVQDLSRPGPVDPSLAQYNNDRPIAQDFDSAVAGGNARGQYAVDWQQVRWASTHVASGASSVVAGGNSNTASGSSSFVGGGYQNLASATGAVATGGQQNTASNTYSTVAGGQSNLASGAHSAVISGQSSQATGSFSVVAGGSFNYSTALASTILGGTGNVASGSYSWVPGGTRGFTRGLYGRGAWSSGYFSADGDAQASEMVLRAQTTDATVTVLTSDGAASHAGQTTPFSGSTTTNQYVLPNASAATVRVLIIARDATNGFKATWDFLCLLRRDANASATGLSSSPAAGSPIAPTLGAGAFGGTVTVSADTTNGGLTISVTGVAATNIKWVARVMAVEVVG